MPDVRDAARSDDNDLTRIEALADAATPGPWVEYALAPGTTGLSAAYMERLREETEDSDKPLSTVCGAAGTSGFGDYRRSVCATPPDGAADRAFIAAARADVPALIARVRELEVALRAATGDERAVK